MTEERLKEIRARVERSKVNCMTRFTYEQTLLDMATRAQADLTELCDEVDRLRAEPVRAERDRLRDALARIPERLRK